MKLFLRGVLALAFAAALALTASADSPKSGGDCGCNSSAAGAEKGRRFGKRLDGLGKRVDHVAESYLAANERIGGCFAKLAGPQVEPTAGPAFGGKQKGGPYTQPGTVVFPQHPFARSPRDFFMMEP